MTLSLIAEHCYAECHISALHTECHYAECRYAECLYDDCRGALHLPFHVLLYAKMFAF